MKKLFVIFSALIFSAGLMFAQSNSAAVDQYGTNLGIINQTGANNNADIDQGTSGSPVTNWGTNLGTDWKYGAFVDQDGSTNDASITMTESSNGSSVYQLGDDNKGYQNIGTYQTKTNDFSRMGVDLDQVGNNNWATQTTVKSFGSFGVQGMLIVQDGDYNIADQLSIGGRSNVTEITQVGNNNNNPTESGNAFDLSATGLTNPLTLPWTYTNQGGFSPSGTYTQYTNQMFGTTHMYIEGNDNNAAQYQEYSVWGLSGDNDAWLDLVGNTNNVAQGQLGEYNSSDFDIAGDGNVVTGLQYGDSNNASVYISGDNNVAAIEQLGNSNTGAINQVGSGNTGLIMQQP